MAYGKAFASSVVVCAALAGQASGQLNQFDPADGYMGAFSTNVWTYHPQWNFDGGALGFNYVAQHGYGVGGAFGAPFGLVVRNDNPAGNYRFSYNFIPFDLGGANPNSVGPGDIINISFDVRAVFHQSNTVNNQAPMLTMGFGGTSTSPGVRIGFSDGNYLMYSDALGNLQEFAGYQLSTAWDRITLSMDIGASTYSLMVQSTIGNFQLESSTFTVVNTYPVVTNAPMMNSLTSMQTLWWEVFTDPENGLGWHKNFFDNFSGRHIPAPGAAVLAPIGAVMLLGRRRRRN